ncbi:MAG: geranylgeranyl reductase family protein [Calditrichaeota bacterium]|nr:MAG: geranylgeranyl reductase family protein [Calditrichota bacterium]
MKTEKTEIAILGAGPGGATTSIFLSKAGIPHVVLDKARFPRDKVCGDALSGKVVSVLNQIDPQIVYDFNADNDRYMNCWGVQFVAPDGNALDIPFRLDKSGQPYAPGFIAKRYDFDYFLFQQMASPHADIRTGCPVKALERLDDAIRIHYEEEGVSCTLDASVVVGAEGDRSLVAKKLAGLKMNPRHYAAGLRAYYENVGGMHPENFIELHFLEEVLPGYLWIFPLPGNRANVGIGLLKSRMQDKNINLRKLMAAALENHAGLKERFKDARLLSDIKGWGLPLGSLKRPLSGERFLLVGDAGSLIDPFTGEGIGNAMISGHRAAKFLTRAVQNHDYSAASTRQYEKMVYDKLWNELNLSHTLLKLVDYPWLYNWVVKKANSNATIRETFTFMFDDLNMRAKLKSPSFYFKLLFG